MLVGGCLRDLLEERPVHDFDVATSAPPGDVLAIFPRAVPTGLRHGTVMVPGAAGPVDVTTFRHGPHLLDDLAHRDFTVNAVAWDPATGAILDPYGGLADLRAGRLRAVGCASERLAEDPLRALRAVRLLAERGLEPDDELVAAMAGLGARPAAVAPERLRAELERILLAPRAADGLRLLRRTGLEAVLAPGVAEGAAERVDAMPPARDERLAAWLLGTDPPPILARLRFGHATIERVARILREHPVQDRSDPGSGASVRRLLHRVADREIEALLALAAVAGPTGAPPEPAARERLEALRAALTRERAAETLASGREVLALDGKQVMEVLGCGPGPRIGAALRYLTELVLTDPASNQAAILCDRLRAWAQENP